MITRTRIAWLAFIAASIASTIFGFYYFSRAIPLVNVNITMSREEALNAARELARTYNWGPQDAHSAASFDSDHSTQTYVELEAGGKQAFIDMIEGTLYSPYQWHVRLFKPNEVEETAIFFTPQGMPYGFSQTLSENAKGAALSADAARKIAETTATNNWKIDFTQYALIESSQEERPSKRIDHTFTYERPDVKIGNANYRLKLVISGDTLTKLAPFVKVPETFISTYKEMRSSNTHIAFIASIFMYVLYIFGGCIIGLFILTRKHAILWRIPTALGFIISFAQLLNSFNQLPLYWMHYDTALSTTSFLLQAIFGFVMSFLFMGVLIGVCAAAAESLGRLAFGDHPLFWNIWKAPLNHSYAILSRTISAYLIVPLFLAFVIIFQMIVTTYFDWWMPASPQADPNILATYAPWLSSIANSAQAGFWEECLFRAVPLAGAALIGRYFGREKIMIAIAFVAQALIFGAAHANYPNLPCYARIIELIAPSFMFGFLYLRYGLLTSIISHYVYDVFWFSLPIFVGSFTDNWMSQIMIIIGTLAPLLIILAARYKAGAWHIINTNDLNASWRAKIPAEQPRTAAAPTPLYALSRLIIQALSGAGMIGLIAWYICTPTQHHAPALKLSKQDAIAAAQKELTARGFDLSAPWQPLAIVDATPDINDRFIWQNADQATYDRLQKAHYVSEPHWLIRFVRFSGTIDERAEEMQMHIDNTGNSIEFNHKLAESIQGAQLDAAAARERAHQELFKVFGLQPNDVQEISAQATQRDNRRDWTFTFEYPAIYTLKTGSARIDISIIGDTIGQYKRYIHVPEEWAREEQRTNAIKNMIQTICALLVMAISVIGGSIALTRMSQHALHVKTFVVSWILFVVIGGIQILNSLSLIIAHFNTTQPYQHQLTQTLIGLIIQMLLIQSALYALCIALLYTYNAYCAFDASRIRVFITGISLGLVNAGIFACGKYFKPMLAPLWADYASLGATFPAISFIRSYSFSYCTSMITFFLLFMAIDILTRNGTRRTPAGIVAFLIAGLCMAGSDDLTSIPFWIAYGLFLGSVLCIEYYYLIRFDVTLVPILVASMICMKIAQQAFFNAVPSAIILAIISIAIVLGSAWYWLCHLRAKNS